VIARHTRKLAGASKSDRELDHTKKTRQGEPAEPVKRRIFGPVLMMVGEFEASVKKHPLIAMGTPDPYLPAASKPKLLDFDRG
jgi:hypothetical protein